MSSLSSLSSLSSMAKSAPQPLRPDPDTGSFVARNPLVVVAIVILLALTAAYVHVLNEAVVSAERTRESWRAAEVEKVQSRATVRDLRVRSSASP